MKDRNSTIAKKMYKSDKWKLFVKSLKKEIYETKKIKVRVADINDGLMKVVQKYDDDWLGYWSLLKLSKSGRIQSLNLFDIDDIDILNEHLRKKGYKI